MVVPNRECRDVVCRFWSRVDRNSESSALRRAELVAVAFEGPLWPGGRGRMEEGGIERNKR
jgi:hypothetical protein